MAIFSSEKVRRSRLVIGIDEAGYGPNLGPLVIGCSIWSVDHTFGREVSADSIGNWMNRLSPEFMPNPISRKSVSLSHIPLGDSKKIHAGEFANDSLALGVLYWLRKWDGRPTCLKEMIDVFAKEFQSHIPPLMPWYQQIKNDQDSGQYNRFRVFYDRLHDARLLMERADEKCCGLGIRLLQLKSTVVDERRFNQGLDRYGNKSNLLSHISLDLVRRSLNELANHEELWQSIHVFCDKHGGRNRYLPPLLQAMPEIWFDVVEESTSHSCYRSLWGNTETIWTFQAKGDQLVPCALASMLAKWLRELFMVEFNRYWRSFLPGLSPTAGYPADAKRFRLAIEPIAIAEGLEEVTWWRKK